MKKSFALGLSTLLCTLLCAATVWGQTGTSGINGTVSDPQGKPIPGAKVTLTNVDTNATRTMKSTDTGTYAFDLITPGNYRIEVEAGGFKKAVFDNVVALIGKETQSDVRLEIGQIAQTVEVRMSGEAVVINTQDASLGSVFETTQISQLPLEARNLVDLLSLQPGATREGYVAGARAYQSNVTLDGVDINNIQTGNAEIPRTTNNLVVGQLDTDRGNITTGPVLRLNTEAIEEFRVTTTNGNANQGSTGGAQINLVTKSGTNDWHGAAFEFYRGTLFEANDWFSNAAGVSRTPLVRNTFGGALGGPVWKNKLFFFYSYEGRRDATATPEVRVVPLANLGQGIINYTYCPDAACTAPAKASLTAAQVQQVYSDTGINQTALSALAAAAAKYPANSTAQGDGLNTGGFLFNAPTPTKLNSSSARLDYTLNSKQNLFVRLNYISDHQILPQWLPGSVSPEVWSHPYGGAIGHNWAIGNNWVNSFRYGLTRQSFTQGGDSTGNDISFRFVFQPNGQTHPISRVTPVHNFTDDLSWIHGNHTIQFGANIRKINNARVSFANAFDNAITNPSFYLASGDHVSTAFQDYLTANHLPGDATAGQSLSSTTEVQNAATAAIGRFSQYTANFTFGKDGSLLSAGSPSNRNFATQAYDEYVQDAWKIKRNLTLTLGLRYSLERPVYETQGFEVQPGVLLNTCQIMSLSAYFENRLSAAKQGNNYGAQICVNKSGPANGGPAMYNWDKNEFQPRVAVAWSPRYSGGLLHALFGDAGKSVVRGGFALTNDAYGEALAVDWDLNNTLGFTSNYTTPANTYDTQPCASCKGLAPLFTGFNQDVRSLPNVVVPPNLQFPLFQPLDEGERIESSVDSNLHAPKEYAWNLTYEREMRAGMTLSVSYIGRSARGLLARRDVAAFNDVVDPKTGMDWYTAGTILEKQRQKGVDTSQIAAIPFFEDLFPAGLATIMNNFFGLDPVCSSTVRHPGFNPSWSNTQVFYAMQSRTPANPCFFFSGNDWTDTQALVDQVMFGTGSPTRFMQPQYGALSAWSTIANSNYNALAVSLRQRIRTLTMDVNYTYGHSLDDASGLQASTGYAGAAFIENPILQGASYANSSFDIRHLINASAVWQMPLGKGRAFLNTDSKALDAIVGGWQLSGIYRWNTGLPVTSPYDDARWATNWNVQSRVTPLSPIAPCADRTGTPKLFGSCNEKAIYDNFRNAYPGETGPRNYLRLPGYMNVDLGLAKLWNMPWSEKQHLQLRWDVFNVANYQPFGAIDTTRSGFGVKRDPSLLGLNPPTNWSNFTQIQGNPRVMQIGARFSF